KRAGMGINGEALVKPDVARLKTIVLGAAERHQEVDDTILANFSEERSSGNQLLEPLLNWLLQAGVMEILLHQDIDSPIIINDYLNVTHAFYEKGEVSFVNAILDAVSKILRD